MELINKYFPELSIIQSKRLSKLFELYTFWNEKINVISRKDMHNFYLKHVLHCLAISKVILFKKGAKVLDIGSGGGFPAIPLAIIHEDVRFFLSDSINK
ncbi:MAG TPA: 16S rRNA (guanine(527)-N(7))-methyltransferase RsmG, partial [Cytophagales bacterium]|nr:16S rRNA (guanine(527)-N(7))-methyltransferase RsmG [Cytophagales bacterium]